MLKNNRIYHHLSLQLKAMRFRIVGFITILFYKSLAAQSPPVLSATGDEWYCVNTQQPIVSSFNFQEGTENIDGVYIQISGGYESGSDQLFLIGEHPKFSAQWNATEAKLSLIRQAGATVSEVEYEQLVQDVVFESSNPNPSGTRIFSITAGSANYLPLTGHYYEFVPDTNVLWTQAKERAATRTYFGLQGYLATLTQAEEAKFAGELSAGTGWIGATDKDVEGKWIWDTGPEAGQLFWDNGTPIAYSFWNSGEPNNSNGIEHYAHITDNSIGILGSWNDLPNETSTSGPYQAKGYMVEYGGMPGEADLDIAVSTQLRIPQVLSTTAFEACEGVPVVLTAAGNTGEPLRWYAQADDLSPLYVGNVFSPNITSSTLFWVEAPTANCTKGPRLPVQVNIQSPPELINTLVIQEQCDNDTSNDGIAVFNLNVFKPLISENYPQETFRYFSDPQKTPESEIFNLATFENQAFEQRIYVSVLNTTGCENNAEIVLKVGASTIDGSFNEVFTICESVTKTTSPGIESWEGQPFAQMALQLMVSDPKYMEQNVTLKLYRNENDAILQRNPLEYTNANFSFLMDEPYEQQIWARVDNLNLNEVECLGISPIGTLKVEALPNFERVDATEVICSNIGPEVLEVRSVDNRPYTYTWYLNGEPIVPNNPLATQRIVVDRGGLYEVVAQNTSGTLCESRIQFTIKESSPAILGLENLTVTDLQESNNTLLIDASGLEIEDYGFSIDAPGGPFQQDLLFENILPGIHRLYVSNTSGCGNIYIEFSVLGYDTFFTPNQDGFNDYWNVQGINEDFQPETLIYIFDRNGVLLHSLDPLSEGWDGTYNGRPLPADDYWFRILFQDGRLIQGHFSLIRG